MIDQYKIYSVAACFCAYSFSSTKTFFFSVVVLGLLHFVRSPALLLRPLHMIILLVVKLYLLYIDFKLSEHKYRTLNKQRNAIEDRRKLHSRRLKVVAFLKPPAVYGGVK